MLCLNQKLICIHLVILTAQREVTSTEIRLDTVTMQEDGMKMITSMMRVVYETANTLIFIAADHMQRKNSNCFVFLKWQT